MRRWFALSLVAAASACSVTESGNPPDVIPLVAHELLRASVDSGRVTVAGLEAITPGGGSVLVANLDRPGFATAPVSSTGSFEVTIPFETGDRLRLQAIDGDRSSLPCDLERDDAAGLRLVDTSQLDCLNVTQVGATWTLSNACGRELDLQLRASRSETVITPDALFLPDGSDGQLSVVPAELPDVISVAAMGDIQVVMLTRSCPDMDGDGLCDCPDLDNDGICDP